MKRNSLLITTLACGLLLLTAAAAIAEKPILIGTPLPLTGPYASDGEQMKMALELAVEEKNAAGRHPASGVAGRIDLRHHLVFPGWADAIRRLD